MTHEIRCIQVAFLLLAAASAQGQIVVQAGSANMFRDLRSSNDIGIPAGDRVQFGANISGGSAGDYTRAIDLTTGFSTSWVICGPLATNPNFCSGSFSYSTSIVSDTWQIQFGSPSAAVVSVGAPSLQGSQNVPGYPSSVRIEGAGTTPTISWVPPANFSGNGVRVNVYDKSDILPNGSANLIGSASFSTGITSYSIPSVLSSGRSLQVGGNYSFGIQLIDTRDNLGFTGNNAQILARSNSFFDFSPLGSGGPPNVYLPSIQANGVYNFSIEGVGPNSITFIDPLVAIGYDYAIGAGDPNFMSVTLPDVGGGHFVLHFSSGGRSFDVPLDAETQYFFPTGGVSGFEVTGIDPAAGLAPNNGGAFVTGLTFEDIGSFTGTMTPITLAVPEPAGAAMLLLGVLVLALRTHR